MSRSVSTRVRLTTIPRLPKAANRRSLVPLCAASALVLSACAGSSGSGESDSTIQIGAVMPLSGPAAQIGESFKKGTELAVDRVNSDGGIEIEGETRELTVDFHDDESSPVGASSAVQDLLASDNRIFLGPVISSSFDTAYGVLKNDPQRLVLTPAAAAEPHLTENGLLFKTQSSQNAEAIGEFTQAIYDMYEPETVAIVQTQDPTGDLVVPAMVEGFEEAGAEVVYENQVTTDTTDYVPVLSAIKKSAPELVVTPYLDSVGHQFMQQAVQIDLTEPQFVTYGGSVGQIEGLEDKVSEFTYAVTTRAVTNPDDPALEEFRTAYLEKYGSDPEAIDFYALAFYDQVLMLAKAIEAAGSASDVDKIAAELREVTDWEGKALSISFDEKGLAHYPGQLVTIAGSTQSYTDYGEAND